ncbi:MAG: hypothetical protein WCP96_08520 [Methylococcaceae bacterium]
MAVVTVTASEHALIKSDKGTVLAQLSNITMRVLAVIKTPLSYVVGGFANNNYWSSTENDSNNAWNQNFNNGNQNNNNKNNTLPVRAVRGFK